jgi:hypothetical protein
MHPTEFEPHQTVQIFLYEKNLLVSNSIVFQELQILAIAISGYKPLPDTVHVYAHCVP